MRHLKMLPGAAAPVAHPVWIERLADVASDQAGIFCPSVERGSYVAAGTTIGRITIGAVRALAPPASCSTCARCRR